MHKSLNTTCRGQRRLTLPHIELMRKSYAFEATGARFLVSVGDRNHWSSHFPPGTFHISKKTQFHPLLGGVRGGFLLVPSPPGLG